MSEWITTSPKTAMLILLSAVFIYLTLILFTRISGLRSFSKMSAFDFAMTIAVGSIMASVILLKRPSMIDGAVGLGALFALQAFVAFLRRKSSRFSKLIDNEPKLLMKDGKILYEALAKTSVTEDDLIANLRSANVLKYDQVRAVVLETTGGMSVLHSSDPNIELEDRILTSVRPSN